MAVAGSRVSWLVTSSMPTKRPTPRTSPIILCLFWRRLQVSRRRLPILVACSRRFSFSITSRTAVTTAELTGLPPYCNIQVGVGFSGVGATYCVEIFDAAGFETFGYFLCGYDCGDWVPVSHWLTDCHDVGDYVFALELECPPVGAHSAETALDFVGDCYASCCADVSEIQIINY